MAGLCVRQKSAQQKTRRRLASDAPAAIPPSNPRYNRCMPQDLKELEENVIDLMLTGDHPTLHALREQWKTMEFDSVEFDPHGFFINYKRPE